MEECAVANSPKISTGGQLPTKFLTFCTVIKAHIGFKAPSGPFKKE
jgi:hypothetical protein